MAEEAQKLETPAGDAPVVVKKYANRRLYNTQSSSYVTLEDLCQMVKEGVDFVVRDAKTGEDITRSVLTQIIVEEEAKGGQNMLPIGFLRRLISFYGDNLQGMVSQYLDFTMRGFAQNQDQMRETVRKAFGGMFPFGDLEEMSRRNLALYEQTMRMFAPFAGGGGKGDANSKDDTPGEGGIDELKAELARMQKRLDDLAKK